MKEDEKSTQASNNQEDATQANQANEQQENEQQEEQATTNEGDELQKTQAALAEANDKYVRLYAEFENFRRRVAKEKLTIIETANQDLLRQLLGIVDDFERAMAVMHNNNQNQETVSMQQGIQLIHDKFTHLLQQAGAQTMEINKGSDFNPELHEAVTQIPVKDDALKGKVVDVLEKGYYLKEQVLRFAKVVIGA